MFSLFDSSVLYYGVILVVVVGLGFVLAATPEGPRLHRLAERLLMAAAALGVFFLVDTFGVLNAVRAYYGVYS